MSLLAIDLGGTKLAMALFSETGQVMSKKIIPLEGKSGRHVGDLIIRQSQEYLNYSAGHSVNAIGIAVPGIYYKNSGTVWAPNIPEWEEYPLLQELQEAVGKAPVAIDSDRACCILGEQWKGSAKGSRDAIFLSVGTGIGAGILIDGKVLRGSHDIAGAMGWMAINLPYRNEYRSFGCFEYFASGDGIAKITLEKLKKNSGYKGALKAMPPHEITAHDVFDAFEKKDLLAQEVIRDCITFWGMAVANLVSLFNPEKIIFGGGIFGPANKLLPDIEEEAQKWAQPKSMQLVKLEPSTLGGDAGLYGAAFLALKLIQAKSRTDAL